MAKEKKVFIKQRKAHAKGFRLGRHLIKMGPAKEYSLNEKEQAELKRKGPQAWVKVITKKEMDAAPKTNAENKEIQDLKKSLIELGYELTGKESLEELKEIKEHEEMHKGLCAALTEKGIEFDPESSVEELEALLA